MLLELLFLELHGTHAPDSFFALDALFFTLLEHFFVFDTELAALDVEAVERSDNSVRIGCLAEVGKGKAAERARLIEVVVERVGSWDGKRDLEGCE